VSSDITAKSPLLHNVSYCAVSVAAQFQLQCSVSNCAVSDTVQCQLLSSLRYCTVSATAQSQLLRGVSYWPVSATAQSPLLRSVRYCAVSATAQSQILVLSTVDSTSILVARYKIVNWVFHNYALRGYDIFKNISHISVAPRANSYSGNTKYGSRSRQPIRANPFQIQLLTIYLLFQVPKLAHYSVRNCTLCNLWF
jgi:hypothetical protein